MLKKTIAALLLTTTMASAQSSVLTINVLEAPVSSITGLNDQGGYRYGENADARYDRLADEVERSTDLDRLKEIELILMRQVRSAQIPAHFKEIAKTARTNRLVQECEVADGQRKIDITANARGGGRYAWITNGRLALVQQACLPVATFQGGHDENEHDAPVYFDQSLGHTLDDPNPEWNIRLTLEDATWHRNAEGTPCSEFTTVSDVLYCVDPTGIRFTPEGTWTNNDNLGHDGAGSTGIAFQGRAYEAERNTYLNGNCAVAAGTINNDGVLELTPEDRASCTFYTDNNQPVN